MKEITAQNFTGERALFRESGAIIRDCTFHDGESPLKHSADCEICTSIFEWKYPLWYSQRINLHDSTLLESARSGIWYGRDIAVRDCLIDAPKTFRRCDGVKIERSSLSDAKETLWNCQNIEISDCNARGDYFAMNSKNIKISRLNLSGNYAFDGCENVELSACRLTSKDAFWNCKNVTIRDSVIIGEYFGWNSENIELINCTFQSLQGFCYIKNLVMRDCKTLRTERAFEYSDLDVDIKGAVESLTNPNSGRIVADKLGEVIITADIDPLKTIIKERDEI